MSRTWFSSLPLASLLAVPMLLACNDDSTDADAIGDGDGDGDTFTSDGGLETSGPGPGDGDGDGPGDGDGDGPGDGDGDNPGDGDGDNPGDGDGEDPGDGDGDVPCAAGTLVCEDGIAKVCDGIGGFSSEEPCDDECSPNLGGCVACLPGTGYCDGDTAYACSSDGSGHEAQECDGLQGIACNANAGSCEGVCTAQALGSSYIGCDYYPTVTLQHDSYNTAPQHEFAVAVANAGDEDAIVVVTQGDGIVYDTVVPANSVEVIKLPWVAALTKGHGPTKIVTTGAYRLRSDRPIVVYQYNPLAATTTNDSSLLFPTNVWGNDTMVAAWPHWNAYPGFYTVVAHEDNTTVTVTPPPGGVTVQAGAGILANGSGQIVLNNSDVLQVPSANGSDVTGTLVSADKPVQVFGGHECTNVPSNITACDHLEEALFPIQTLADEYIVVPPVQVPNFNLAKAQMVRIIATEPDTQITLVPDQGIDQTLPQAGSFVQLSMTTAAFKITSTKPLLVVQYMVGQSAGFGSSDPAMVQAVTPKQFRTDYLFFAAPSWDANFVDIIAPDGAGVTVDGANVASWSPITGSGYSVAHVQLNNAGNGTHTVEADQKVGISVYGVRSAGSYWYPGGLDLEINPQ